MIPQLGLHICSTKRSLKGHSEEYLGFNKDWKEDLYRACVKDGHLCGNSNPRGEKEPPILQAGIAMRQRMDHLSGHSKIYRPIPEFAEPGPLTVTPTDKRTGQIYMGNSGIFLSVMFTAK